MRALGIAMLPLSVVPFIAVRGDVIKEHDTYVAALHPRPARAVAPGLPLPHRAPAPPFDAPVRPSIPLGRGASLTLGTKDGSVLVDLTRQATTEGRRLLIDSNADDIADVTVAAGTSGVKIVACQTSVAALAASGSGRRADGGTTVHLPTAPLGAAPRFAVSRGAAGDTTCRGASFAHVSPIALPGGRS